MSWVIFVPDLLQLKVLPPSPGTPGPCPKSLSCHSWSPFRHHKGPKGLPGDFPGLGWTIPIEGNLHVIFIPNSALQCLNRQTWINFSVLPFQRGEELLLIPGRNCLYNISTDPLMASRTLIKKIPNSTDFKFSILLNLTFPFYSSHSNCPGSKPLGRLPPPSEVPRTKRFA